MAANPLTVVTLNPVQAINTGVNRHEMQEDSGGAQTEAKWITDENGRIVGFGRGVLDPNVTYMVLLNTNNQLCYIFPNAAGNGIIVSTVKP